MKKSTLILATFVCLMLSSVATLAYSRAHSSSHLLAAAKAFVEEHFPGQDIAYTEVDSEYMSTRFEVHLNNGFELTFNEQGTWEKIDCHYAPVPEHLVPAVINDYVNVNFQGAFVTKIDKEHYGYEVELSNNVDL